MATDPKIFNAKNPLAEDEGTHVDLGDDLLNTRTIVRPFTPAKTAPDRPVYRDDASIAPTSNDIPDPESVDEKVVNAKILRGEGLIEEAKKTLRQALLREPGHLPAQQLLAEIQTDEVSQILRGNEPRSRKRRGQAPSPLDTHETSEEILRKLEADLKLSAPSADGPFADEAETKAFLNRIDQMLLNASAFGAHSGLTGAPTSPAAIGEARIDLGIAFLEMGLPGLARTQFEQAQRETTTERKATLLLAQCLLELREAFEALLLLDPWVADASRPPEEKLEVGYLMARAYEELERWGEASLWFQGVVQIDPDYRDALERFQRCERIRSSSSR